MWPDQVSNPGPLTYESGALLIALRGPAALIVVLLLHVSVILQPSSFDLLEFYYNDSFINPLPTKLTNYWNVKTD